MSFEEDTLYALCQTDYDPDGQDRRPVLLERQQDIREMLMKLKKGI